MKWSVVGRISIGVAILAICLSMHGRASAQQSNLTTVREAIRAELTGVEKVAIHTERTANASENSASLLNEIKELLQQREAAFQATAESQERINQLQEEQLASAKRLDEYSGNVRDLGERLAALEDEKADLESELEDVKFDRDKLKETLAALEAKLSEAEAAKAVAQTVQEVKSTEGIRLPDGREIDFDQYVGQWRQPGLFHTPAGQHIETHITRDHGFDWNEIKHLDAAHIEALHEAWHNEQRQRPSTVVASVASGARVSGGTTVVSTSGPVMSWSTQVQSCPSCNRQSAWSFSRVGPRGGLVRTGSHW